MGWQGPNLIKTTTSLFGVRNLQRRPLSMPELIEKTIDKLNEKVNFSKRLRRLTLYMQPDLASMAKWWMT
jgi:dynactin complex subunit